MDNLVGKVLIVVEIYTQDVIEFRNSLIEPAPALRLLVYLAEAVAHGQQGNSQAVVFIAHLKVFVKLMLSDSQGKVGSSTQAFGKAVDIEGQLAYFITATDIELHREVAIGQLAGRFGNTVDRTHKSPYKLVVSQQKEQYIDYK